MPPARPVDRYARCYYRDSRRHVARRSPSDGVAVAGERRAKSVGGRIVCSNKREAPPGKPVASKLETGNLF
jgi:hypothetical protein